MQMKPKKEIEFRLIEDNELPALIFKSNERDRASCVIVINQAHKIWLGLHRSLEEQLMYAALDMED